MKSAVRKEIMPFVFLTCLQTSKFKTASLSLNLLTQLTKENASKNALLPKVLLRGTKKFPDMERLAAAKDELYGMRLEPMIRKKGEIQCFGFYADFVDDQYTPGGEKLLEKAIELLGGVLLDPVTEDGRLTPRYVDGERENLINEIQSVINDKRSYSVTRLTELMCDGEDYSVYKLGGETEARRIDSENLTEHYEKILGSAAVEIFYCGGASPGRVEVALVSALKALPRREPDYETGTEIRMNALTEEPRIFTEEMDVTQGKLAIGFRLGECMYSPDYVAISLFNYIYGGSVNSKLFLNVREKLSLCYFASSMVERHKGLMIVSSGIEFDKYDVALKEILAQLGAIKNGDVGDREFENAKSALITDLKAVMDSQLQLEDFYLGQAVSEGELYGPMELAGMVPETSKETVIDIARGVEQDSVYFLKSFENPEEGRGA